MKDMETMRREIRTFYEAEANDVKKCMDLGDTDTLEKYLVSMVQAVQSGAIHKHTAQQRLDEISAYAEVKHGVRTANLLISTQIDLNLIITDKI